MTTKWWDFHGDFHPHGIESLKNHRKNKQIQDEVFFRGEKKHGPTKTHFYVDRNLCVELNIS